MNLSSSEAPRPQALHKRSTSFLSRTGSRNVARRLQTFLERTVDSFPWPIEITDWEGVRYALGGDRQHWCGRPLVIKIHTPAAGKDLLNLNVMRFLERFLVGEADLEGNLYILTDIARWTNVRVNLLPFIARLIKNKAFQSIRKAHVNVKSHYDIPQEALNIYLDKIYMSYSCGMFSKPNEITVEELLRAGKGEEDDFDSLEKAQWRKFNDAVDFIAPKEGETLLDIGCGYGGQLIVALDNHPFAKVVGWTHSANQVREGTKLLSAFDKDRWELSEGDYRKDTNLYDHITSTGMISHVGPRGLVPYVKNVRRRIKKGGRYVHHSLMIPYSRLPIEFSIGIAFNKKYVWPGFHWFSLGQHVRALEQNGFTVKKIANLSPSYAKTTAAWYERMMANKDVMISNLGEQTFRAWQIYLAGGSGSFVTGQSHVYRIYCVSV